MTCTQNTCIHSVVPDVCDDDGGTSADSLITNLIAGSSPTSLSSLSRKCQHGLRGQNNTCIYCVHCTCIYSKSNITVCLLYVIYTCVVESPLVEPEAMNFNQTQNKHAMVHVFNGYFHVLAAVRMNLCMI